MQNFSEYKITDPHLTAKYSETCSEWGLWIILSNHLECFLESVSNVSEVLSTTNDIPFTSIIRVVPELSVGDL